MSTLLYSLGRWSFRHPWRVLVSWLIVLVLAGGGMAVFAQGTNNTFTIPGTESQEGLEQLNRTFPQVSGTSAQFIVVAADGDQIDDPAYVDAIEDTISDIEGLDDIEGVTSPYDDTVSGTISDDGTAAIVQVQLAGQATDIPDSTTTALEETVAELQPQLPDGAVVSLGGDLYAISIPGLSITELLGVVIALLVLIVTFRSFVVAGLPLITAILGVALSMALIMLATAFADVSSTTPLLALMLGLAVGIDYALFIISRHQDQARAGVETEESVARATGTAGSAVVFAGITVLIALIGLSLAGIPFLTTMGVAASVAVAIAVAVAVTLTPAFLRFTGGRIVGWKRRAKKTPTSDAETVADAGATARTGFAARWVGLVTRHPVITTIAVVVTLGTMAIPAASLALALPNAGQLAEEEPARVTYDLIAEEFGPGYNGPLVMTGTIVTSTDPVTLMDDLGDEVAAVPGVKEVVISTPNETADTGFIQIIPDTAPDDPATSDLVRELRSHHDEWLDEYGIDLSVTGFTAVAIDVSDRLGAALVPFGIFVVGLSLVLLMIVFRSIWVPVKAALGYLLSVAASFGVVAAVFEWGWFAEALHVTRVGPVISFMPIVLMGVLFGLAMDYEVFLVSRMREDYVHGRRKNPAAAARTVAIGAVRSGFTASARVVTAAGVIMFAVFAAFVPEGDASLKPIALGLATGILVDAFIVRMTLVPAVLALLGAHAWWMPRWLERRLPHFDIEGEAVERELALADWPEPGGGTAAVVAEELTCADEHGTLYRDVALDVAPGEALVLHGGATNGARALALTIAGRLAPTDGRLRVDGHLLPERAAWVRGRVPVAVLDDSVDPGDELREAISASRSLLVIDGLDRLVGDERDDVLWTLRSAGASRTLTVVAAVADPALGRALLTDAGYSDPQTLDLSDSLRRSPGVTDTTEVHA